MEYRDDIYWIDSPRNRHLRKLEKAKQFEAYKAQVLEENRKLTVRGVASYYSYEKSVILLCNCREEDVCKQILTIESFKIINQVVIDDMGTTLKALRNNLSDRDKRNIFLNKHYLEESIPGCTSFHLEMLETDENYIPGISDIYKSLVHENRLVHPEELILTNEYVQKALNIALLGFARRLTGVRNAYGCPVMNPLPPDFTRDDIGQTYLSETYRRIHFLP